MSSMLIHCFGIGQISALSQESSTQTTHDVIKMGLKQWENSGRRKFKKFTNYSVFPWGFRTFKFINLTLNFELRKRSKKNMFTNFWATLIIRETFTCFAIRSLSAKIKKPLRVKYDLKLQNLIYEKVPHLSKILVHYLGVKKQVIHSIKRHFCVLQVQV